MSRVATHLPVVGFGSTLREDRWWVGPVTTVAVILTFIAYATFRVFENKYFRAGPYLSPFFSPYLETHGLPFVTPAMLILPAPLSFRFTCYYYRKAYYRSFAMSPPACAVGGIRQGKYNGERKLLLIQNLHRYALYLAILVLVFLWHDVWESVWFPAAAGGTRFGVGGGTIVLFVNTALLTVFTFSCHAFRHLVGGGLNSFANAPLGALRHLVWRGVTKLNASHMAWAWISLFGVGLSDFYIRMVAAGAFHDPRLF